MTGEKAGDTVGDLPEGAAPPTSSGLRGNRNWQKLWAGQTVSLLGDFVFDTTLVLWVGTRLVAGSDFAPIAVSAVLIATALPVVLVGPLAGVFVDRWNRRATMLICDLVRAALVAVLLAVALAGERLPPWLPIVAILVVVALASATAQFFNPARFASIAAIVAPGDREQAFSLATATSNAAVILGPPLAAPLLFSVGVEWALAVNAFSFLVSYACIRWVDWKAVSPGAADTGDADRPRPTFTHDLAEGWRLVWGNRVLRTVVLTVALYTTGVGAINTLQLFFVVENLHAPASLLGVLSAALGAGSVAGALVAAKVARTQRNHRMFAWGMLATAVLVFAYARASSPAAAIVVLVFIGVTLAVVNIVVGPILLAETPNRLIGRVSAIMNPLVYLSSVCSMALTGVLAAALTTDFTFSVATLEFHRVDTIFVVAGLLMTIAGLVAVRSLRAAPATTALEGTVR